LGPWIDVDAFAPYSNYGRSAISVAAPGGTGYGVVWSACSTSSLIYTVCQSSPYWALGITGTSMSSPHVSGLAALAVEDVGRKPGRIRALLQQSADDLGQPGTDPFYGKGRINVASLVGAN
jgi:subtilisin family serine protease